MTALPVLSPDTTPDVTPELLRRHDRPCPRYTSYPTADRFGPAFRAHSYERALARADTAAGAPLALYTHLPFCHQMCAYCGCNVVVSKSEGKKGRYLELVMREAELVAERLPSRRGVSELHFGGGTPNSYTPEQLADLLAFYEETFDIAPDAEIAMEVDPRHADADTLHELRDVGFNRVSFGVQDFDPLVQEAIGRVQSLERTTEVVEAARAAGFRSVNVDLIYGLPQQTPETFAQTVERTIELQPDRIALFSFAYVPRARPNQKRIDAEAMPDPDTKLRLFCDSRRAFLHAGWEAIGMDHFARPGDPLAVSQREGTLGRNFQGYTVGRGTDLIGFGMSAIGDVGGAYVQNAKRHDDYKRAIEAGELAAVRGHRLTEDDAKRRWIIRELMCGLELSTAAVEERFGGDFQRDFRRELSALRDLEAEGLVEMDEEAIRVTPLGRLFVRNVAAAFDRYLLEHDGEVPYSRVV